MNAQIKLSVLLLTFIGLVACKESDPPDPTPNPDPIKNEMIIGDTVYGLEHGEILRIEAYQDVYYAPIYICSDSYVVNDQEISGTGQSLQMMIVTDGRDYITPGTYTFKDDIYTNPNLQAGTFIAGVFRDWDFSTWKVFGFYEGTSGTLKVSRIGEMYTFEINFKADLYDIGMASIPTEGKPLMAEGVDIKITYKGKLEQKFFG